MTEKLLIYNAYMMPLEGDPIENGWLLAEDGRISALGQGAPLDKPDVRRIDAHGQTLLPGLIDLHAHGGDGHEVMDATPEALLAIARFYARHGVTSFLPTTWTAPHADILRALQAIADAMQQPSGGAQVLGAHVEGPYISPSKPGAQNPDHIRPAEAAEARELLATGVVRLLALAPEIAANQWLIGACREQGITVSAAHTDATYAQMRDAVQLGITQTTHTFNAMRGLHHREPGTVGAAMLSPALRCELIADGVHVHPAAARLLYQAKTPQGLILISDAVRGAGLPDGTSYQQDGRTVTISEGSARLDNGTLAGSVLTLDAAVRNLMQFAEVPLAEAWRCASLTPAEAIGVAERKGSLVAGKDADLVLLAADHSVTLTLVGGQVVYAADYFAKDGHDDADTA